MTSQDMNRSWNLLSKEVQKNKIESILETYKADHEIGIARVFNFTSYSEVIVLDTILYFDTEEQAINYCLDIL